MFTGNPCLLLTYAIYFNYLLQKYYLFLSPSEEKTEEAEMDHNIGKRDWETKSVSIPSRVPCPRSPSTELPNAWAVNSLSDGLQFWCGRCWSTGCGGLQRLVSVCRFFLCIHNEKWSQEIEIDQSFFCWRFYGGGPYCRDPQQKLVIVTRLNQIIHIVYQWDFFYSNNFIYIIWFKW